MCIVGASVGCSINLAPAIRGSGNVVSESRDLSDFTAVQYGGSGYVTIKPGETHSLVVTCDDNLLEYVTSNIEDGTLVIRTTGNFRATKMQFDITLPKLTGLMMSGSGSAEMTAVTTDKLAVNLSGSGSANLDDIRSDVFSVTVTGSGGIRASGASTEVNVAVTGSGSASLSGLVAKTASASSTGSGSIQVQATQEFTGVVTGSGGILCSGSPPNRTTTETGSGRIQIQ